MEIFINNLNNYNLIYAIKNAIIIKELQFIQQNYFQMDVDIY